MTKRYGIRGSAHYLLPALFLLWPLLSPAEDLNSELREAALVGDIELVDELLAQGADPNSMTRFGKSALMFAVEEGSDEVAFRLIERGGCQCQECCRVYCADLCCRGRLSRTGRQAA